jgi:hypothetical protein
VISNLTLALQHARTIAGPDGIVCATGSLFVVAETREIVGLKTAYDRFNLSRSTEH